MKWKLVKLQNKYRNCYKREKRLRETNELLQKNIKELNSQIRNLNDKLDDYSGNYYSWIWRKTYNLNYLN